MERGEDWENARAWVDAMIAAERTRIEAETVAAIVADLHRQADAQDHRSEVGKAKASALMAAASRLASGEWRK